MNDEQHQAQSIRRVEKECDGNSHPDGSKRVRQTIFGNEHKQIRANRTNWEGINSSTRRGAVAGGVVARLIAKANEQIDRHQQGVVELTAYVEELESLLDELAEAEDE